MTKAKTALTALLLSAAFAAPVLAQPAPTAASKAEVQDHRAHDLMVAMMSEILDVFARAEIDNEALQKKLLTRIEADIAGFIRTRENEAFEIAAPGAPAPAAAKGPRFATASLPPAEGVIGNGHVVTISYLTTEQFLAIEHDRLMLAVAEGLMDAAKSGALDEEPAMRVAETLVAMMKAGN
ncbi:hypothetical protein HK107_10110 [Parvularcula sp. ZS-1/3]|uniref:Uncharacterized protein n=1 Tax=Parvularcula mediterranea TaxID=2732508 RepID=A0A7Y3W5J0_9PROT|nr:hypothetical protein [Parvularcula mediterranea]NNU16674.1 hypothetical protein [Parvularcula mediterranea]